MHPESGIWLPGGYKFAANRKKDNDVTICRYDVIINFFLTLPCFSCQVQLLVLIHVNIMCGSGVMTVFFYKGLTRNPEIRNTPV